MNWFKLLKSKAGKLTLGVPQAVAIIGVGMALSYSAFHAEKKDIEQQRLRSLTSISNTYDYGGLRQTQQGLSSINVDDSLNQLATAEERARMSGSQRFSADAIDRMEANLSGAIGQAAKGSDTEGLGLGNREAVELSGAVAGANTSGVDGAGIAQRAAASKSAAGSSNQGTLSSASMARASGGGAVSSPFGGSTSVGSATMKSRSGSGSSEGYTLSGAMPGGSAPISLGSAAGRGGSSFTRGGRGSTVGAGKDSRGNFNDLKDITKRTAEVTENSTRAANEATAAYFAKSTGATGITLENGEKTAETGSADFKTPMAKTMKKLRGNLGKVQADEQKRLDYVKKLLAGLFAFIAFVVPACFCIKYLKQLSNSPYTAWAKGLAAVVFGAVVTAAAVLIRFSADYWKTYVPGQFSWMGFAGCMIAALGAAGAAWAFFGTKPQADLSKEADKILRGKLSGQVKGFAGQGLNLVGGQAKTWISEKALNEGKNGKKS